MVSVMRRMRVLRALLDVRLGPGAAILPKDVKRLHMDFAVKMNDGHLGPRKFWKLYLPRLKYHNPAVSMTVNRKTNQQSDATMTVFFSSSVDAESPAKNIESSVNERAEVIDMKHRHESDILKRLMEVTRAVQVKATEEELLELRQMQDERIKSEEDRVRMAGVTAQRMREKELLAQAKASIAGAEAVV